MSMYTVTSRFESKRANIQFAAVTASTYDAIVQTFEPNVISYWKFDEPSGNFVDTEALQNAVVTGTPERTVATIVDLDTVAEGTATDGKTVAWTGNVGEYAEAANNAAYKTAEGTIIVTAQHDSLTEKSTLVAGDSTGAAGGFSIEVNTNGSPRAYLRPPATTALTITGSPGDIVVNRAYAYIFKWGPLGLFLSVYDDTGALISRVNNATTAGLSGTSPIRFGAWHTDVSHHDGPYGRVIWLNRQLAHTEEPTLARAKSIAHEAGGGTEGEYITTPELHGWVSGISNTAGTAAINSAIADASTNAGTSSTGRGVVELVPGRTYTVRANPGTRTNPNSCLPIQNKSNVEIRTQGKPTIASGNQAIIQMESWSGKTQQCRISAIEVEDSNNVVLGWVTLDGNKASCGGSASARNAFATGGGINYNQGGNGALTNLRFSRSNNCRLEQLRSRNALTDGISMGHPPSTPSGDRASKNFLAVDCTFTNNRRQGMTVIMVGDGSLADSAVTYDSVVFRRCTFTATGDDATMKGQAPGANVDIEPQQIHELLRGLTFDDCDFTNAPGWSINGESNTNIVERSTPVDGRGIVSDSHAHFQKLKIINCRATGNNAEAFQWNHREDAETQDGIFEDLVATGNGTNQLRFNGQIDFTSRVVRTSIINCNVSLIFFETELSATGNSVTIWKGDFNPTVTTNGRQTITVNNGFPP